MLPAERSARGQGAAFARSIVRAPEIWAARPLLHAPAPISALPGPGVGTQERADLTRKLEHVYNEAMRLVSDSLQTGERFCFPQSVVLVDRGSLCKKHRSRPRTMGDPAPSHTRPPQFPALPDPASERRGARLDKEQELEQVYVQQASNIRLDIITEEVLEAAEAAYAGVENEFQTSRRGIPLQYPSWDLRWPDSEKELQVLHELAQDCTEEHRDG